MRSVFIDTIGHLDVRDSAYPRLQKGSSIIKVLYSGICGSDIHVYHGKQPRVQPPTQFILGHEASGIVHETYNKELQVGAAVALFPYKSCGTCAVCRIGKHQLCVQREFLGFQRDGTFADYVLVPDDDIFVLPATMTIREGVFVEPFAVAIHAIELSNIQKKSCLIVGGGTIGLCIGIALREVYGIKEITFVEINKKRAECITDHLFNCVSYISNKLGAIDTVFECSGSDNVLKSLLAVDPPLRELIIVSTFPRNKSIPIFEMTKKEILCIGSQAYQKQDFKKSLECIAHSETITHFFSDIVETREYSLEEANGAFQTAVSLHSKPKVLFKVADM